MTQQLDLKWLRGRRESYLRDHYIGMHVTIISVALATAGVAAASLVSRQSGIHLALLWLFWGDSLLAVAVAYGGTMVGAFALPPSLPSVPDLLLPLFMGVVEFLLFTVLISQITSRIKFDTVVATWFVAVTIFAAVAGLAVWRARHLFSRATSDQMYRADLAPTMDRYLRWLKFNLINAGAAVPFPAVTAVTWLAGYKPVWLPYAGAGLILLLMIAALISHGAVVRMWQKAMR